MNTNRVYKAVLVLAIVVALAPMASAGLIFYNELPIDNVNGGANRSNVDISFGPVNTTSLATSYYSGDAVTLPLTGVAGLSDWRIDKIVIWSTGRYSDSGSVQNFGTEYTNIALMGGSTSNDLNVLASGTYTSGVMDPAPGVGTIHTVKTSYPLGSDYIGSAGHPNPVMMTTFDNLNYVVPSGEFAFGVYTGAQSTTNPFDPLDTIYGSWRNLLSNNGAGFGNGGPSNAADGTIYYFSTLYTQGAPYSVPASLLASTQYLDVNFEIFATAVPEPATYTMVGLGLLGAVLTLRRRR